MEKTPDEIKKGLEMYLSHSEEECAYMCRDSECPYKLPAPNGGSCGDLIRSDAIAYIQQLEEDNAKKHEKIMQLYIALEDMQSIVQSITKDSKTTFQQLVTERDEAYEAICDHCMDIPCQENECYWYRKMNQKEETKT